MPNFTLRQHLGTIGSLLDCCPNCTFPYASNFKENGHLLTNQPVCNGAPGLTCVPTIYMAFTYPASSMQVEVEKDGEKYRGVVYLMKEEGSD